MPPWIFGCSVLTRPPSISGLPVSSSTSVTSSPAARSAAAVPPEHLEIVHRDKDRWHAEFDGEAGSLTRWLGAQSIRDFTIGPPDLETIFRAFYRREQEPS